MSSPNPAADGTKHPYWAFRPASLLAFSIIIVCLSVAGFLFARERFASLVRLADSEGMLSTEGQGRVPVAETLRDWKIYEGLGPDVHRRAGKWSEQDIAEIRRQVGGAFFVADRTTVVCTNTAPGQDDVIEITIHDGEHAGKTGWTSKKWFGPGKSLETAVRTEGVETMTVEGPPPTVRRSLYTLRWILAFVAACAACGFGLIVYRYRRVADERDHLDDLYERMLASRTQAVKDRDRMQTVLQFLINVLSVGRDVTVRTMLDHAADRIESEFSANPEVAPQVMMAIAGAYRSIGEYDAAMRLYVQASSVAAKVLGADNDVTLTAEYNRATILDDQRQPSQAEEIHRNVLQRRMTLLGPTHPHTLGSMQALAIAMIHQKKHEQAQQQLESLFESQQRSLGQHHADLDETRHLLISVLAAQSRYDLCERVLRKHVDVCREHSGYDHERTLSAINELSQVLIDSAKAGQAVEFLEQSLRLAVRSIGASNAVTATATYLLGLAYARQGQYEHAEKALLQSFEMRCKMFGAEHKTTQQSQAALAKVLAIQGKTPLPHCVQMSIPRATPTTERHAKK